MLPLSIAHARKYIRTIAISAYLVLVATPSAGWLLQTAPAVGLLSRSGKKSDEGGAYAYMRHAQSRLAAYTVF